VGLFLSDGNSQVRSTKMVPNRSPLVFYGKINEHTWETPRDKNPGDQSLRVPSCLKYESTI
jgi:hypothetical protein